VLLVLVFLVLPVFLGTPAFELLDFTSLDIANLPGSFFPR